MLNVPMILNGVCLQEFQVTLLGFFQMDAGLKVSKGLIDWRAKVAAPLKTIKSKTWKITIATF